MRPERIALVGLIAIAILHATSASPPARAITPSAPAGIDRVEEDWEVVVGTPSPTEVGPQMTTTMSPSGDNKVAFASFYLNYRDDPFRAGGLHLRAWSDSQAIAQDTQRYELLSTSNETITWTQRMRLSGGSLTYEVVSGESTTWPKFGQGEQLDVIVPSSLTSLDAYRPDYTAANSGVSWQSNRVASMKILRVRYYSNGQLVSTDETPRTIVGN
jgi:hypothetical protein